MYIWKISIGWYRNTIDDSLIDSNPAFYDDLAEREPMRLAKKSGLGYHRTGFLNMNGWFNCGVLLRALYAAKNRVFSEAGG